MSKYKWFAFVLPLAVTAACSDDTKTRDALAEDTSLTRDLAIANQDTSAQPALQDVPATEAPVNTPSAAAPAASRRPAAVAPRAPARSPTRGPVTRTPARTTPQPAAPSTPTTTASGNTVARSSAGTERAVGMIPAGTTISMASNSRVCTNTHRVGQRFSATISETVTGSNGATIPAGARATIEITELNRSENARDDVRMGFRVVSVSFGGRTYPISATTTYANVDKVRNQPRNKDVQKVVGGAAAGAIIGQILGKDTRSTVIGAATGAAAGAATAAATSNFEGCVPDGGRITISLNEGAQVQV